MKLYLATEPTIQEQEALTHVGVQRRLMSFWFLRGDKTADLTTYKKTGMIDERRLDENQS